MALTFADGSTDNVAHGTAVGTFTVCSMCAWINLSSAAAGLGAVFHKASTGGAGRNTPGLLINGDEIRIAWRRATTNTLYESTGVNFTTAKWWFVAATFDQGASPVGHLYVGDLATLATEPAYGTTTDGTGAFDSNASTAFTAGNSGDSGVAFAGSIAVGMFWPSVVLTLAQFQQQQFRTVPIVDVANCKLFTHYGYNGTSTQPDWSGNANAGTVTGATLMAEHVPIPFRRVGPLYVPYTVTAPTGHVFKIAGEGGLAGVSRGLAA